MKPEHDIPRIALIIFVFLVGGAMIIAGATSGVAFNTFNPDWDGTSELQTVAEESGSEPVIVRNTTQYETYGANTTAFILSPDEAYTPADAVRIQAFLERGGTLVVADRDGPHGADLLAELGIDARPAGPILRDERQYYEDPALPIATGVESHRLTEGVDTITLNHGTAIEPNGATALISSSPYAYLDVDGSETLSENETVTTYPVATVESVGDGAVVTVGDPSVFINVMQEREGNRAFSSALVSETDRTVIDISRSSSPPPLVAGLLTIRDSIVLQAAVALSGLLLLRTASKYVGRQE